MIRPIKTTALAATITLALTACGGGGSSSSGGNTAGIGGSGYISSGTITGFGSVFVNGVEFETNSSAFDIEGTPGTQSNLAIGMVVRVNGTINPDGITGTASSIIFDDELQGPVSGLTPITISSTTTSATFTVLGTTVKIDRSSTSFDGTTFNFDTIADNDNVEISGFFNASGTLLASRVELKDAFVAGESIVEVKGEISALIGTTFDLLNPTTRTTIPIDTSRLITLKDLPDGLVNGLLVEVEGTFDGTIITATKIESEELELSDSDEFELEGYITDFVDSSNFKINGIPVDASSVGITLIPSNISLANDLKVEAEGSIVGNTLIATELKLRGGELKVSAEITAVGNNTFQVTPVADQPFITIELGTETELKNEILGTESLEVFFTTGDFVEIEGFENDGSVFASQVKIVDIAETDGVELQGVIQTGATEGSIKVLGVEFVIADGDINTINTAFETTFEDQNEKPISQATFNSTVTLDSSVVSITDDVTANGTANKIEIEEP